MWYAFPFLALALSACQIVLPVSGDEFFSNPIFLPEEPEIFLEGRHNIYLGQNFTLKKPGRVLRLQLWLKGPEPNTDLVFSIHRSKGSTDFMLEQLAMGTTAKLEGTRLGTQGRKITAHFTSQPVLEAEKLYSWVVRSQSKSLFFLLAHKTTDKENLAYHSTGGWRRFAHNGRNNLRFDHVLEVSDAK